MAMTTQLCVDLNQTTAVIEWQSGDSTRYLATPDPNNSNIQFTLQLDATEHHGKCGALFEVVVPIKFKDQGKAAAIYVRISPLIINSFDFRTKTDPPDSIKAKFDSATTCLDFRLDKTAAMLVPSYVQEPITALRPRSGKVLDALRELSHVTSLRIYIQDALLSSDQLRSISDGVTQRILEPFSGSNYDISRMFSGEGAKHVALDKPAPPSYDKAASLLPPMPPPYERKRLRSDSDQQQDGSIKDIWEKLRKLESMVAAREPPAKVADTELEVQRLSAENTELKQKMALLEEKVAALEHKNESLERDVAALQTAHENAGDEEEAAMIAMREDIQALEKRADYIERGKDDEDFANKLKEDFFLELAARVTGS